MQVLKLALKDDTFLKTFAGALVKLEKEAPALSAAAAHNYTSWLVAMLDQLQLPQAQKAVSKMLQLLGLAADRMADQAPEEAARTVGGLLTRRPEYADELLGTSKAQLYFAPLWALGEAGRDVRETLFAVYGDKALAAKVAPSSLEPFRPFLETVTPQEWSERVLPVVQRVLKRTPEVAIVGLSHLTAHLKAASFADLAAEMMPVVLVELRHAREDRRGNGQAALRALADRADSLDAVKALTSPLVELLSGKAKSGRLGSTPEKLSASSALASVALGLPESLRSQAGALGEEMAGFCCEAYGGEPVEDAKIGLLNAAAAWLEATVRGPVPPRVSERLAAGLKEKDALKKAHLSCLTRYASASPAVAAELGGPLASSLAASKRPFAVDASCSTWRSR